MKSGIGVFLILVFVLMVLTVGMVSAANKPKAMEQVLARVKNPEGVIIYQPALTKITEIAQN